jgi:hypothetical protein
MKTAYVNEWEALRLESPQVHAILEAGGSAEDCCVKLAQANRRLTEKLMQLMTIAPRRIRMEDGTVMVWHCPDAAIPETDLRNLL